MKKVAPGYTFPMRINQYFAAKNKMTRREVDGLIKEGKIFLNGAPAKLGDKVYKDDAVEFKYRGKKVE